MALANRCVTIFLNPPAFYLHRRFMSLRWLELIFQPWNVRKLGPVAGRYRGLRRGPLTFQISARARQHAPARVTQADPLKALCLLPSWSPREGHNREARDRLEENG